jgi:hypothetical protein
MVIAFSIEDLWLKASRFKSGGARWSASFDRGLADGGGRIWSEREPVVFARGKRIDRVVFPLCTRAAIYFRSIIFEPGLLMLQIRRWYDKLLSSCGTEYH